MVIALELITSLMLGKVAILRMYLTSTCPAGIRSEFLPILVRDTFKGASIALWAARVRQRMRACPFTCLQAASNRGIL